MGMMGGRESELNVDTIQDDTYSYHAWTYNPTLKLIPVLIGN